jgi:hypothetical protein
MASASPQPSVPDDIYTVAGTGTVSASYDGGQATDAGLDSPAGVAVDASGNIYIADTKNNRVQEVPATAQTLSQQAVKATFSYTGAVQTWTVPSTDIWGGTVRVAVTGGGGGSGSGDGAVVDADIPVTAGETLSVYVGQQGGAWTLPLSTGSPSSGGAGGWGYHSGGNGGAGIYLNNLGGFSSGAGGGGSSAVLGGSSVLVEAGGSGGSSDGAGGNGGTPNGAGGWSDAGTQASTGATQAADGEGGTQSTGYAGTPAHANNVTITDPSWDGAGGGGGGHYGGGGGVYYAGETSFGGGGGSSWVAPPATDVTYSTQSSPANGSVTITYNGSMTAGDAYTIAGSPSGVPGASGDLGAATSALLDGPTGVAVDSLGDLYIADSSNNRVQEVAATTHTQWGTSMTAGDIYTVAGSPTGTPGSTGDGGAATSALLDGPTGVAVDSLGDVYIADSSNNRVQEVAATAHTQWGTSMTAGDIYTVAGSPTGTPGSTGDGGAATSALLHGPYGVAVGTSGDLYVADEANNRVQEVAAATGTQWGASMAAGDIYTVEGSASGSPGCSGDGGPATSALLDGPGGVALGPAGDLFTADSANNRVRELTGAPSPTTLETAGYIYTAAGTGAPGDGHDSSQATGSQLGGPTSVAFDAQGDSYIADAAENRVQEVPAVTGTQWGIPMTAGNAYTVAGSPTGTSGSSGDGSSATSALLDHPEGVAVDSSGDLYIADTGNNRVQEVAATAHTQWNITMAAGDIYTVAGSSSGTSGTSGDAGAATSALLHSPAGVTVDSSGDLFIADTANNRVQEVTAKTQPVAVPFAYGGAAQTWTAPSSGVPGGTVQVAVTGGGGGSGSGEGAVVDANLPVTPGEALSIYVGQQGGNLAPAEFGSSPPGGAGGWGYHSGGDGGAGSYATYGPGKGGTAVSSGAGGGGSSAVLNGSTVLVEAGGAGGSGDGPGGNGGAPDGAGGWPARGAELPNGATQAQDGEGQAQSDGYPGRVGAAALGLPSWDAGGGGGGGYYGGGGGGVCDGGQIFYGTYGSFAPCAQETDYTSYGGGGGSSWAAPPATDVTYSNPADPGQRLGDDHLRRGQR